MSEVRGVDEEEAAHQRKYLDFESLRLALST